MHADLSRSTFRPDRHYSAVLAQQGRVQLDADANEQTQIQLHQARTMAADLIGQHGGPRGATGFEIDFAGGPHELDDLTIGSGRYYVDGILCDATRPRPGTPADPDHGGADHNRADHSRADHSRADHDGGHHGGADHHGGQHGGRSHGGAHHVTADGSPATWTYWDQPDAFRDPERPADRLPTQFPYLVYLKVWERSVSAAEDPDLREVALGSAMPDTAARTKVVWQVLPLPGSELELPDDARGDTVRPAFQRWAEQAAAPASRLAARSERPEHADEDPCLIRPDARYRGPENQLYRVEIHDGDAADGTATFKWSRENGSVVFPVDDVDGTWAELASFGNDDKLDLTVGDWVEVVDTAYSSRGAALPLLRVEEVDLPGRRVRLSGEPDPSVARRPELHPFLRRWDQSAAGGGRAGRRGVPKVDEGKWLALEDGVEVFFEPGGRYRTGDHWLIPARTATGGVEWPVDAARRPLLQAPAGIRVHHAPLAWVLGEQNVVNLRMVFAPLAHSMPFEHEGS